MAANLLEIKMRYRKAQRDAGAAIGQDTTTKLDAMTTIVDSFNDIPTLLDYIEELRSEVSKILHMWHAAETKVAALNEEKYKLQTALESAVEALNHQADLVSEWSATKPSVYTVEDFL